MNESRPLTGCSKVCMYVVSGLLILPLILTRSFVMVTLVFTLDRRPQPPWISPVWSLHPVDQCESMSRPVTI